MSNLIEVIKYISLLLFIFFSRYKIIPKTFSNVMLGIGIGIVANIMFVVTTAIHYNGLRLLLSSIFGIILITIGSLEKKEKQ